MTTFNQVVTAAFDLLHAPLDAWPPWVGITIIALVSAVGMLFVFRLTSRQRDLAVVKRAIQADLFEIRLFNDDLRAVFRAQGAAFAHSATYLRLSLPPTLWLAIPISLLMLQMEFHYGYGGLTPGRPALVTVALAGDGRGSAAEHNVGPNASLEAPPAVRVISQAIWFPGTHELMWRVIPDTQGNFELRVRVNGATYAKSIQVGDQSARRSPHRPAAGLLNQLLDPSEPPLPEGVQVTGIEVGYPPRRLWMGLHWAVVYLALCLAFASVLKGPLGVVA